MVTRYVNIICIWVGMVVVVIVALVCGCGVGKYGWVSRCRGGVEIIQSPLQ